MNKAKELANIFGVEEMQTFYLKNDEETQLKYKLRFNGNADTLLECETFKDCYIDEDTEVLLDMLKGEYEVIPIEEE